MSEGSGEKGEIPGEVGGGDAINEPGGPSLLRPSGIMGRGVCGCGELAKRTILVTEGTPKFPQPYYHIEFFCVGVTQSDFGRIGTWEVL